MDISSQNTGVNQPLKVFISYSHKNLLIKQDLVRALSNNPDLEILSDDLLQPGKNGLMY